MINILPIFFLVDLGKKKLETACFQENCYSVIILTILFNLYSVFLSASK